MQNEIVWFWPNSDPKYEDILSRKKPPYIPELDDPSYARLMGNRDIQYGYAKLFLNYSYTLSIPIMYRTLFFGSSQNKLCHLCEIV